MARGIVRQVDPQKRTVGEWFSQELCGPIGAAFYCGPSDPRYADSPEADMLQPNTPYKFANGVVPEAVRKALPDKFPQEVRWPGQARTISSDLISKSRPGSPIFNNRNTGQCIGKRRDAGNGGGMAGNQRPAGPTPDVRAGE